LTLWRKINEIMKVRILRLLLGLLFLCWSLCSCLEWPEYSLPEGEEGGLCRGDEPLCNEGLVCNLDTDSCEAPVTDGDAFTTWTDSSSGLAWQNPEAGDAMIWQEAKDYCSNLTLDGGGWRLPKISELRGLIRGCSATESGGSCDIDDEDCLEWSCWDSLCTGCSNGDGPADGCYWPDEMEGVCKSYWSSSPSEGTEDDAWHVYFNAGGVYNDSISRSYKVRCVR